MIAQRETSLGVSVDETFIGSLNIRPLSPCRWKLYGRNVNPIEVKPNTTTIIQLEGIRYLCDTGRGIFRGLCSFFSSFAGWPQSFGSTAKGQKGYKVTQKKGGISSGQTCPTWKGHSEKKKIIVWMKNL